MGGCQHLLGVVVLGLLAKGLVVAGDSDKDLSIQVKHERHGIFLICKVNKQESVMDWRKDYRSLGKVNENKLFMGSAVDDHRGLYECQSSTNRNASLQLHFRMCQYCVQLDFATMMGLLAAEVVATAFLAGAVCTLAAQEPSRLSQASDKQTLLAHDQLYQPLGERNNGQYSHIGVAKARHR